MPKKAIKVIETVVDFQSRKVTIFASAWQHVLRNHPVMALEMGRVTETLKNPELVREQNIRGVKNWLYHRSYTLWPPSLYLRVAVRWLSKIDGVDHGGDGFLTSAYPVEEHAKGELIWPQT